MLIKEGVVVPQQICPDEQLEGLVQALPRPPLDELPDPLVARPLEEPPGESSDETGDEPSPLPTSELSLSCGRGPASRSWSPKI